MVQRRESAPLLPVNLTYIPTPSTQSHMTPTITIPTIDEREHNMQTIPTQSSILPPTKIATLNIDCQAWYNGLVNACVCGDINILHCTDPADFITPGTQSSTTLINITDKAGYALYITKHSHTYIR